MSRTDVHRPYWVQVEDETVPAISYHSAWGWDVPEKQLGHRTCGCRTFPCSPHYTNRQERRRSRHEAKLGIRRGDYNC